ncbi:hypothetical protein M407DRAFT_31583 [Tulasnella calospora MUT 4182]|uniref:Uncharacterized protein n=1 Tax=Tulasnella calospora MUT 4182 TaxID=1051891 RepID=A0A0C3Q676_9AGAM|nr:hypothetical protein M407DRAFT_31583 [Tulasnella calospora MUT 4182]
MLSAYSDSSSGSTPLFSTSPASTRMSSLTSSPPKKPDTQPPPYAAANLDDRSAISPVLASRICTSVLDHVLYLNGQIPFPVQGLSSLNLDGKANAKAAKKRDELVTALDLLSSHLPSTFQSLSWALATNPKLLQATSLSSTTAVDVVLVTGPTPTTVRSRCFIRLGDFSISRYGDRQQVPSCTTAAATSTEPAPTQVPSSCAQEQTRSRVAPPNPVSPVEVEENDEEHDPEADASFASFISDMSSALSSTAEEERSEDEGTGDEEDDDDDDDDEDDEEESDASSSIASEDEEEEEETSEEDFDEENADEEGPVVLEDDTAPKHSTPSISVPPPSPAEDEKNIRACVRAVSLALASTFDFGRDDIPINQMNVLLRAPRCFQHPSWLPKQALGRTLDGRVDEFFSGTAVEGRGVRKGPPEEGVLVRCNSSLEGVEGLPEVRSPETTTEDESQQRDDGQHDMIWWQWSAGVIRGFGDI